MPLVLCTGIQLHEQYHRMLVHLDEENNWAEGPIQNDWMADLTETNPCFVTTNKRNLGYLGSKCGEPRRAGSHGLVSSTNKIIALV